MTLSIGQTSWPQGGWDQTWVSYSGNPKVVVWSGRFRDFTIVVYNNVVLRKTKGSNQILVKNFLYDLQILFVPLPTSSSSVFLSKTFTSEISLDPSLRPMYTYYILRDRLKVECVFSIRSKDLKRFVLKILPGESNTKFPFYDEGNTSLNTSPGDFTSFLVFVRHLERRGVVYLTQIKIFYS